MGYSFEIGQLKVEINTELGREATVNLGVQEQQGNATGASYVGWSNFAEITDLSDFFFDDSDGLIREHPATYPLCEEHRNIVNEKYKAFKAKYPTGVASYEYSDTNAAFERLEWLKYWINWALDNCKNPVFHNS